MTLGTTARIEVFVNGQPIGQPFTASELVVSETKGQLLVQATRYGEPSANQGLPGATGTNLDGFFGDV